jgi:hypothetical protein
MERAGDHQINNFSHGVFHHQIGVLHLPRTGQTVTRLQRRLWGVGEVMWYIPVGRAARKPPEALSGGGHRPAALMDRIAASCGDVLPARNG